MTEDEARARYLYPGGRPRIACSTDEGGAPTCQGDGGFCGYSPQLDQPVCFIADPPAAAP